MDTLIIQLTNHKAYKLLQELEELHLIRVLKNITQKERSEQPADRRKASDYKGVIPREMVEKMQQHVKQSREEWDQRF